MVFVAVSMFITGLTFAAQCFPDQTGINQQGQGAVDSCPGKTAAPFTQGVVKPFGIKMCVQRECPG